MTGEILQVVRFRRSQLVVAGPGTDISRLFAGKQCDLMEVWRFGWYLVKELGCSSMDRRGSPLNCIKAPQPSLKCGSLSVINQAAERSSLEVASSNNDPQFVHHHFPAIPIAAQTKHQAAANPK